MNLSEETIAAPPDGIYSSYEEAYNALKSHGIEHGYGFHLKKSTPHHSNVKTYFNYRCDYSRNYKSQSTTRKTKTRTAGCPFSLVIQQDLQWRLQVKNSSHNHGPSLNPTAHNVYRRRTQAQKNSIQRLTQAGTAPKQILTSIQQENPETFIGARDIWNKRIAIRTSYLAERTPIEALLDKLSSEEWAFDVKRDQENHIQYLFFAHKKQIELLLKNPDVILLDCTYRTNKY